MGETTGPAVRRRPLTRAEVADMARRIRELLDDPDAGLSVAARHRWEGALVGLEAAMGERPSLVDERPERFLL